jgi:cation channel sperm-associated protein 2
MPVENNDLALRTKYFRNSLIDEFRLSESDTANAFEAPKYSSDAFRSKRIVDDILRYKPHTLIKFKIFKRAADPSRLPREARLARGRKPRLQPKIKPDLPLHVWATRLSHSRGFQNVIIAMIVLNAMILGAQTFLHETEDWRTMQALEMADAATMVVFVLEILIKWVADFRGFWKDGWNVFDFLVTAGALAPVVAQMVIGADTNAAQFATLAKNLRIFRTFRTLKMIAKSRSLRIIVRTIVEALQQLGFVLVLLSLLMYIFAILGVGLFSDYSNSNRTDLIYKDKFTNILTAVRSLFTLLTLDQWMSIAAEITSVPTISKLAATAYFLVWVALGAFIFRNIFIGVMVKNFQSISQELSQIDHDVKKKRRMQKLVVDFDAHLDVKRRFESERKQSLRFGPGAAAGAASAGAAPAPSLGAGAGASAGAGAGAGAGAVALAVPGATPGAPTAQLVAATSPSSSSVARIAAAAFAASAARLVAPSSPLAPKENEGAVELENMVRQEEWERFVDASMRVFREQDAGTTMWPRDTLLEYLQTMELMQENMKEFQELQHLAAVAVLNIVTDS